MSACFEAAPSLSLTNARAARLAKFERERLIVDSLNRGLSVAEIAARIDVSEKRMRTIIREIVARRMPAPPEEFVAIQVSRLSEALLVAYSAMTDANLKAVDRVVRIVRDLDRYHGFSAAAVRRPEPERLEAPVGGTATYGAALVCRAEFARGEDEELEGALGLSFSREAAFPDLGPANCREATPAASAGADRPENPAQDSEKIDSAPEPCHPRGSGGPAATAAALPREPSGLDPDIRFLGHDEASPKTAEPTLSTLQSEYCPENPPQDPEKMESGITQQGAAEAAPEAGGIPLDTPMILTPGGWRRPTIRMTLNGVMAC